MTAGLMLDYVIVGVLGVGVLVALVVRAVWRLDHPRPRRQRTVPEGRSVWVRSLVAVAVLALTQIRVIGSAPAGQRLWIVVGTAVAFAFGLIAGELWRIDLRARADDPVDRHRLTRAGVLAIVVAAIALAAYLAVTALEPGVFVVLVITVAVLAAVALLTLAAAHAWRRIRPARFAPRGD